MNPLQLFRRAFAGERDHSHPRGAAAPLPQAEDFRDLAVEPNTALASFLRARAPRWNLVELRRRYRGLRTSFWTWPTAGEKSK
jgi:hypothetical protein